MWRFSVVLIGCDRYRQLKGAQYALMEITIRFNIPKTTMSLQSIWERNTIVGIYIFEHWYHNRHDFEAEWSSPDNFIVAEPVE